MKKLFLLLITSPVIFLSQNKTPVIQHDNMLWFGYYNTINIKSKWSISSDVQFRTSHWYNNPSQALIRSGVGFKLNDKITLTAGIAHFRYFINDVKTRGEWRPWQEIAVHDRLGRFKISHRLRIEQRFNEKVINNDPTNEYQFNYRIRYKFDLRFPITKEKENGKNIFFLIGDELMINAGRNIVFNYFDQNRSYVGINFGLTKKATLQLQYMHVWQQLSSGNTFLSTEVIRINFYHTLQL